MKVVSRASSVGTPEACVLLSLANDPALAALQSKLRTMLPDVDGIRWTQPAEFHVTLVYANLISDDQLNTLLAGVADVPTLDLVAGPVSVFDQGDQKVLILPVGENGDLAALQKQLADDLLGMDVPLSEYSLPDAYNPHITLAYMAVDIETPELVDTITVTPQALMFSRGSYETVKTVPVAVAQNGPRDDCVSEKIAKLVEEGYDQDQAAAIAYDMCEGRRSLRSLPPSTIRIVDEVVGELDLYIALWGSPDQRDSYNTWFDREKPPEMALDFLPFPLMYEHAQDGVVKKEIIGKIVDADLTDPQGIRAKAFLFRDSEFFDRVVSEIKAKEQFTSSATADHTADFDDEGRFVSWPIVEVSLTKNPAEERMPPVTLVRSAAEDGRDARRAEAQGTLPTLDNHEDSDMEFEELLSQLENGGMDPQAVIAELLKTYSVEELMAIIQQSQPAPAMAEGMTLTAAGAASPAPAPAVPVEQPRSGNVALVTALRAAQIKKLQDENAQLRQDAENRRNAPPPDNPIRQANPNGNISVSEPRKFFGRSREDLMFGFLVLRSANKPVSEDYRKVMAARAIKAIEKDDPVMTHPAVRSLMPSTRADEIMISTAAGGGDEWVSEAYSSDLWDKARSNRIFQELVNKGMREEEVPQGAESIWILTEGADPTVYTLAQNDDLGSDNRPQPTVKITRPGTGRVQLTPGELGMAVAYSDVFEEDALLNVLSQQQRQMQEKAEETVEQLFINGDTATGASTNINLIDGTPGTGLSTPYYIASDGALKYALVTGSGTSRDGGALDENDFRLTLKLFPSELRTRKGQIAWVFDPDTHNTALDIPAIKTEDVKRTNATIVSGVLENIYGVDAYESGFMLLANSAGKVPAGNGTLGRILGVYAPYWAMGWKRRVSIETDRDILFGGNLIVARFRLGFKVRGAGAAVASYNLTIA